MSNKLYVGNLPYTVSTQDLENLFSSCGTILDTHIPSDKDTGRPRGFAFVELSSPEEVEEAISKLNGVDIGGRNIKVTQALEKADKGAYTPTRKPYAKEIGPGECILCNATDTLYGFEGSHNGVCSSCVSALSHAVRPPRTKQSFDAQPTAYRDRSSVSQRYRNDRTDPLSESQRNPNW